MEIRALIKPFDRKEKNKISVVVDKFDGDNKLSAKILSNSQLKRDDYKLINNVTTDNKGKKVYNFSFNGGKGLANAADKLQNVVVDSISELQKMEKKYIKVAISGIR